jgi:hypothetical protein
MKSISIVLLLSSVALGCSGSFYARGPEDYKQATRALLETRQADFQACYDNVIKTDPNAAGTVSVHFLVEEKTGKITNPKALPESSAPAPLQECVVKGLDGLALDPPDQRKGDATMVFEFARG